MYQSQNSSPKDNIKFSVKRFHCFSCLNSSENHEKIVFSGCSLEGLGELDRNIRYSHLYRSRFSSGWWSNSRWDCRGTRRGVGWGDDTDEVRQQSCVKSLPQSPSALCSQYWVTRKQDGQVRADNSLLLFSIKESPPLPPFLLHPPQGNYLTHGMVCTKKKKWVSHIYLSPLHGFILPERLAGLISTPQSRKNFSPSLISILSAPFTHLRLGKWMVGKMTNRKLVNESKARIRVRGRERKQVGRRQK